MTIQRKTEVIFPSKKHIVAQAVRNVLLQNTLYSGTVERLEGTRFSTVFWKGWLFDKINMTIILSDADTGTLVTIEAKSSPNVIVDFTDFYNKGIRIFLQSLKTEIERLAVTGPTQVASSPIKILFLAANPRNTPPLRLDAEIRAIDQSLRQTKFRDKFDIEQQWAVRVTDLQAHLLRYKPTIVHFSGHGSATSEILLENNYGHSHSVPSGALSQLFSVLKGNIRCVVLNACYSEHQAQSIAAHVDCVVGMSQAIGDEAAINFATSFYQALGYGQDIKTAFDLGCNLIDLDNLGEQDTPKLLSLGSDPRQIIFA